MACKHWQYLWALGLTEWRARPDGPLAGTVPAPVIAPEKTTAAAADQRPKRPPRSARPARPSATDTGESAAVNKTQIPASRPPAPAVSASAEGSVADMGWTALEAYLAECEYRGAQRPVFGIGARDADVLIVGEAPGAAEDQHGVPFVGRAGKLLDRMLFSIGCSRETNVYITNICKFRPPNNRDPRPAEVAADWPILERQIELMAPKLVVAVGRVAAQTLLDTREPLGRLRGRVHRYPRRALDVLVTYHPAYLLRSPQQKRKAWEDLKMIAAAIAPGADHTV